MKKLYGKSKKEYEEISLLDSDRIIEAMKRYKGLPKKPTSVALDQKTILEIKTIADRKGIPYQVLLRVFILDGLDRIKKS
jgi:hypothetical protein